jgi:hypothetical protein
MSLFSRLGAETTHEQPTHTPSYETFGGFNFRPRLQDRFADAPTPSDSSMYDSLDHPYAVQDNRPSLYESLNQGGPSGSSTAAPAGYHAAATKGSAKDGPVPRDSWKSGLAARLSADVQVPLAAAAPAVRAQPFRSTNQQHSVSPRPPTAPSQYSDGIKRSTPADKKAQKAANKRALAEKKAAGLPSPAAATPSKKLNAKTAVPVKDVTPAPAAASSLLDRMTPAGEEAKSPTSPNIPPQVLSRPKNTSKAPPREDEWDRSPHARPLPSETRTPVATQSVAPVVAEIATTRSTAALDSMDVDKPSSVAATVLPPGPVADASQRPTRTPRIIRRGSSRPAISAQAQVPDPTPPSGASSRPQAPAPLPVSGSHTPLADYTPMLELVAAQQAEWTHISGFRTEFYELKRRNEEFQRRNEDARQAAAAFSEQAERWLGLVESYVATRNRPTASAPLQEIARNGPQVTSAEPRVLGLGLPITGHSLAPFDRSMASTTGATAASNSPPPADPALATLLPSVVNAGPSNSLSRASAPVNAALQRHITPLSTPLPSQMTFGASVVRPANMAPTPGAGITRLRAIAEEQKKLTSSMEERSRNLSTTEQLRPQQLLESVDERMNTDAEGSVNGEASTAIIEAERLRLQRALDDQKAREVENARLREAELAEALHLKRIRQEEQKAAEAEEMRRREIELAEAARLEAERKVAEAEAARQRALEAARLESERQERERQAAEAEAARVDQERVDREQYEIRETQARARRREVELQKRAAMQQEAARIQQQRQQAASNTPPAPTTPPASITTPASVARSPLPIASSSVLIASSPESGDVKPDVDSRPLSGRGTRLPMGQPAAATTSPLVRTGEPSSTFIQPNSAHAPRAALTSPIKKSDSLEPSIPTVDASADMDARRTGAKRPRDDATELGVGRPQEADRHLRSMSVKKQRVDESMVDQLATPPPPPPNPIYIPPPPPIFVPARHRPRSPISTPPYLGPVTPLDEENQPSLLEESLPGAWLDGHQPEASASRSHDFERPISPLRQPRVMERVSSGTDSRGRGSSPPYRENYGRRSPSSDFRPGPPRGRPRSPSPGYGYRRRSPSPVRRSPPYAPGYDRYPPPRSARGPQGAPYRPRSPPRGPPRQHWRDRDDRPAYRPSSPERRYGSPPRGYRPAARDYDDRRYHDGPSSRFDRGPGMYRRGSPLPSPPPPPPFRAPLADRLRD